MARDLILQYVVLVLASSMRLFSKKSGGYRTKYVSFEGYEIIRDPATGEVIGQLERATGEIYENLNVNIPVGSFYITPEQQRQRKANKEQAEKRRRVQEENAALGKFYFVPADTRFNGIMPETVTRLVFLATYLQYDSNRLMLTERTPMRRRDLPAILGLSKATVSRFWHEVSPIYVQEDKDGLMLFNSDVFKRGRIPRKRFIQYQKFYVDGIRKLYNGTAVKYHRRLGYLFKLLPYVNIEYNVLCSPDCVPELDIENVNMISLAEFCTLIGFDTKHAHDLVQTYKEILFDVRGTRERFVSLVYDGIDKQRARIFVNPHIFYHGSDYKKVETLGAFCKA